MKKVRKSIANESKIRRKKKKKNETDSTSKYKQQLQLSTVCLEGETHQESAANYTAEYGHYTYFLNQRMHTVLCYDVEAGHLDNLGIIHYSMSHKIGIQVCFVMV